jgi:hypothetical protein
LATRASDNASDGAQLPEPWLLIREIEGGKEIQEGKARSPGAQEEGYEEGEAGQKSKD